MTYEEFMKKVDSIIASRLGGLTSSDLADTVFTMDRYYDDAEPEEVADEIMEGDVLCRGASPSSVPFTPATPIY